jgi:hypothetical protein
MTVRAWLLAAESLAGDDEFAFACMVLAGGVLYHAVGVDLAVLGGEAGLGRCSECAARPTPAGVSESGLGSVVLEVAESVSDASPEAEPEAESWAAWHANCPTCGRASASR